MNEYDAASVGSAPLDVPDFRLEEARLQYEDDHWTPDPTRASTLPAHMVAPR